MREHWRRARIPHQQGAGTSFPAMEHSLGVADAERLQGSVYNHGAPRAGIDRLVELSGNGILYCWVRLACLKFHIDSSSAITSLFCLRHSHHRHRHRHEIHPSAHPCQSQSQASKEGFVVFLRRGRRLAEHQARRRCRAGPTASVISDC